MPSLENWDGGLKSLLTLRVKSTGYKQTNAPRSIDVDDRHALANASTGVMHIHIHVQWDRKNVLTREVS